jgi:alpha-glucosidase (family GH31 glycosyl hydrolase)
VHRLSLLPYLYTSLYMASAQGGSVARPLWSSFPSDPAAHTADEQWLLGPALMVTPVLHQGRADITPYFPPGRWYSLLDYGATVTGSCGC